ncbi:putative disease resistance protein [Senna tora]|uniref:Putative disease resistance protein n=1 Tax=Senna tora TaxID=362788 RepID=A0A834XIX3_9FABA|nr:putative disease resistance protein [Senna tora]
MGFLSSSVERISKYKPGRTVGYFINYKSNLTELQRQVEDLKRLRYRQQHNGEATIHDEEVLRLIQYGQKLLERPRAWSLHRCRFSREVRETMEEISRLLSLKVENPSYGPGFDLRMSTFWEVMQSLKDDNVRLIGVHGMSGVGKTTLVKEVSRYAVEEGLFDAIVWSVVTPAPDVIRIQDEIAEILGLRLHLTQSQSERADKIYKWLTNNRERKFLIILDDVWDHRDLEGIGIPMAGDCVPFKVLLTSRNIEILRNVNSGMNVIHVTILPKEEAFLLFNQIVGNTASIYSDTVLEIVETCEGLPMAIEVVAEKLKHEPLSEWKSTITEFISHMLSRIKLSYDYLRNEEEKFIFLLCSILGEQIYCQDFPCSRDHEAFKVLKLNCDKGKIEGSKHWIESLLKSCEELWLKEFKDFENVLSELNGDAFLELKHLRIQDNAELEHLPSKVVFDTLETLVLKNLLNFRVIQSCDSEFLCSFKNLTIVKIECCPLLESIFNLSAHNGPFQLRELEISQCTKMVAIANNSRDDVKFVDGQLFFDGVPSAFGFPCLQTLTLQDLDNLIGFFKCAAGGREIISAEANMYSGSLFLNLAAALPHSKHLKLINIPKIRHLVASTAADWVVPLQDLETMEIVECNDLCHLFVTEGRFDENYGGLLPELRQLCLRNLGNFRSILSNDHPRRILNFKMLNQLTVHNCNQLRYLLPHYVLNNLMQVRSIDISDCAMLEQIFGYEEDIIMGESKNNEMLPLLHSLKLSNLPKLASICSGVRHPINLRLKQMAIEDCPNLAFTFAHSRTQADEKESSMESEGIIIVPSLLENVNLRQLNHLKTMWKDHLLSFMHLRSLQLHGCDNLVYLFSLSVARGLSCLQELKIISSTRVEQIVRGEMGVTASAYTVEFPRVNTLILEDLPNMTQFCDHEFTVKWLSLKVIRVVGCPNIRKFSLGMVDIHQFTSVDVVFNFSNQREIDDLIAISHLFKLTDKLSSLEELIIEGLEELKNIMEAQLKPSFFTNLKMLEVRQCDNKLNVFLSILLPRSCRLECLTVENCKLLELVFDLKHLVADGEGNGLFPNLKTMRLLDLPKLNYIWNMDPSGIMDLRKLVKLEIINCGLLRNLASIGVVETLVQLKILAVHSCKMIEEVITIKVGEKTDKEGRCFPNLRDLVIANLPNFRRFNSGNCKFRFPNLLSLRIKHCPKINAFTTGFLSAQGPTINSRTTEHAFDEMMDVYPNLKILELLGLDSLKVIWQGFDSTKSFSELEELEVDTLCNLEYIFPSSMLPRLKKLKTLFVRNCSSLRNVFLLTEKQDIKLSMAFQNLKIVQVQSCDSLRHMLLPSNCLNLEALEISECKNLEEIFIDTEEEKRDAKVLPHLKSIILENLPKLSNFSLETFKFPSLVKVKIVECPALKAFKPGSTRNVSAPVNNFFSDMDNFEKLKELHLTNVAGCQNIWNNDLSSGSLCELQIINLCKSTVLNIVSSNMLTRLLKLEKITVQSNELEVVFDINENSLPDIGEMELLPQLYELVLIDLPYMELWKQEPKIPVFRNLTSLEIIRCKSIKKLFSTSVGKNLDALKLLKLYECINMVQVLQGGGERGQILFNNLECLILKYLPCLTSFCEQEVAFEFPKLQMVKVEGIPNMETFVKGFLTTPKLKEVYTTDIRKCWQGELNATIKWLYQNQDFRDDDYIRDGIGTSNQPAFNATDNSAQFPVESHALAIALDGGGNVVPLLSPAPLPEGDGEVAMFDVEEGGCEVCEGGQQSGEATHKHGDQDDDDNVHVVPRHLVERQDQEASLLTGMPTSQDAVKSNVVEILPLSSPAAPQETEPPSPGTTCALKVPEVREIVELMKLEGVESLMLGEAFKTYPQLCLSREDRSDHLLSFSYRVLLDILNILDSRTPLTITESDKKSLEKNLKDALVLGFDKDWLESTRGKVFDCDLSEVNQAREVLEWLEGELESNEAALAAVCDEETEAIRAVEAAQEEIVTQLCFDTCQQEVGTKLLDARRDMVAKRDQCLQIIAAKDRHFGFYNLLQREGLYVPNGFYSWKKNMENPYSTKNSLVHTEANDDAGMNEETRDIFLHSPLAKAVWFGLG